MDDVTGPHKELARRFRAALAKRNLTVNSASERFVFSREALTRMDRGLPVRLETLERWARAIGEDVNEWRAAAGHGSEWNADLHLMAGIRRIQEKGGHFQLSTEDIVLERADREEVDAILAAICARVMARQAR